MCYKIEVQNKNAEKLNRKLDELNLPIKRNEEKGLKADSMVLGECLRQVSEQRIIKKLGYISSIEDKRNIKKVYDANFGILEEV